MFRLMRLSLSGGRRLAVRCALACASAATLSVAITSSAQAAFDLTPCHGQATAGRGATFPASLHNSGFWGAGFDSNASGACGGSPPHPTYNSATLDSVGTGAGASATGSGGGVGACGGGAAKWPVGYRDTTVRFCATDDPVTPTQLSNIDAGAYSGYAQPVPGKIHQLPWASGAVTVVVHLPEGCSLPAPSGSAPSDGNGGGSPVTGWSGDPSGDTAGSNTTRPYISDLNIQKALAGDPSFQTWGQLIPGITGTAATAAAGDAQDNGTACASVPVIRIVRQDNSGTTFNFKSFLSLITGGIGADPTTGWTGSVSQTSGTGGANTVWPVNGTFSGSPFDAGAAGHQTDTNNVCEWNTTTFPSANATVAADHICGGHSSGAGNVAKGVLATSGSIGYADIATVRTTNQAGVPQQQQNFGDYQTTSGTRDDTFWLPIQGNPDQANPNTDWVEPTKDRTNHLYNSSGTMIGTQGANCANLPNLRNVPAAAGSPSGDATFGDFSKTIATGGAGYPACVLTYGLVWDDNSAVYGNTATEEAYARTVLDYTKWIASGFGQSFVGTDYSTTPSSIQNIMNTGTADGTGHGGIAAIDWNKTACTTNCTTSTTPTTTTTTTTSTTPTPTIASNQFTIQGARVNGRKIILSLKLPGAGRLVIKATSRVKVKKGKKPKFKTITYSSLSSSVAGGPGQATLSPSGAAVAILNSGKNLTVKINITYTPTGGTPNSKTVTKTVKGKKKKRH